MTPRCFVGMLLLALVGLQDATAVENPGVGAGPRPDRLFHKPGLVYFWALNDTCSDAKIQQMVDAFATGGVAAVCLHPRSGLLKPYGGDDWFEFIKRTVDRCAAQGLEVWLYDEDPFPSGNAGGRLTMEHPEYRAMEIRRFEGAADKENKGLYCFPGGTLLWCGVVNESSGETRDLTGRVGMLHRKWRKLDPWDSRYYYPATPRYACPRAWTEDPEYGVEVGEIPAGSQLLAFVAQPVAAESWPVEPDRLNPEATQQFLRMTHERYSAVLGERFGKSVKAIFTDEPKYAGTYPWTPEMFSAFRKKFGYDLPSRLWRLFVKTADPESMRTRLHVREWCGEQFRHAWLEPVSRWCQTHHVALVGHISPEDDPVQQTGCVSNLFPLHSQFEVPGLDLIIPAVGDRRHGLINLGVLGASSAAQQLGKSGVLSETLACSGLDFKVEEAARILRWQLVMGVTTHVIHAAYNSVEGLRRIEAPPDFGPMSPRWAGMVALGRELAQMQPVIRDATQVAPVAILWPVRSFAALPLTEFTEESPLRNELVRLVQLCLDRQVGLHLLDEADLWRSQITGRQIHLGKARYSHLLIPSSVVLHERTILKLREASLSGVAVVRAGQTPKWQQTSTSLEPIAMDWCSALGPDEAAKSLPRLVRVEPDGTDIRCTAWRHDSICTQLIINLRDQAAQLSIDGQNVELAPGQIHVVRKPD